MGVIRRLGLPCLAWALGLVLLDLGPLAWALGPGAVGR